MSWSRPPEVPFPTVWSRFKGRRSPQLVFTVQDLTPEWEDQAVDHMTRNYLTEGSIGSLIGVKDDPESLADVHDTWRAMIRQRAALVALVKDRNNDNQDNQQRLAGVNVTWVYRKGHSLLKAEYRGSKMRRWMSSVSHTSGKSPDFFSQYGVSEYLTALGLSVEPEFRGEGVGEALLRARWPLCRALGVPLTVTTFTSAAAQVVAKRVGFQTVVEVFYADHPDPLVRARKEPPSMLIMAARID